MDRANIFPIPFKDVPLQAVGAQCLGDKVPAGGTCVNLGCIPSKMIIYPADRIVEIQEAKKLGIEAIVNSIDFHSIMSRMRKNIKIEHDRIKEAFLHADDFDFYEGEGHFVDDYTIEVNGEKIKGGKIVLASGSRPFIPPIKGLDNVHYLTNESALHLTKKPESMIIIGGGYVGVEFAHFFAAMGTTTTIIEMADRLVLSEEPEIAALLQKKLSKRMEIITGVVAEEVKNANGQVVVQVKEVTTGKLREISAQQILIAVGRRSNADLLKVQNSGVDTDNKGFIKVDEYLRTSKENIWALGDANGQQMFTHMANKEAEIVAENMLHDAKIKVDYNAIPHAVYSYPQIASVGLLEASARERYNILVGKSRYLDIAKGEAMMEEDGFAKAIVEKSSGKILGFHIIGPSAPELIQEVTNAMSSGGNIDEISNAIHIHPAITELIQSTFGNLEDA